MAEISSHQKEAAMATTTPDSHNVAAQDMYKAGGGAGVEEKPSKPEVLGWYMYGLCSYFVHTVLIPIVFPLIISQTVSDPPSRRRRAGRGATRIYEELVHRAIKLAPVLGIVSILLDYSHYQQLIAGAATIIGAIFCLPAGFFKKSWIFPPYIAIIVAANTIVGAAHARHLGLMIRGFTGSVIPQQQFATEDPSPSRLSLYSTAAGCLGAAIMSSFTYHMFSHKDHFNRNVDTRMLQGALQGFFLSSFMSMCIFGAALLHAMGYSCFQTKNILFLWLTYFMVPIASLPLVHPLQLAMKLDAEKMQLLGFILSTLASGFGFYYKGAMWTKGNLFFFAAVQGSATGFLHAFGRVLWLDCSPAERFGASFCAGLVGMVILIFGNISSFKGAKAAGHVIKSGKNSPAPEFVADHSKTTVLSEVLAKGKAEV
ncbi:hypothetical protein SASPL_157172 [Salvia splendens]|uniref:Uncharacterized protein n=1 Tax=Salvia splendens TaxID=180675 RepID=A0A8X8YWS3_SALSN|nr:hypothetical protein SASPL_157172 [Salvia splendens]